MDTRASPIESAKKVVEVITTHTEFVPPEALGFSVYDDAVVPALSSSFVLQLHPVQLHLHRHSGLQLMSMQRLTLFLLPLMNKNCQRLIEKLV